MSTLSLVYIGERFENAAGGVLGAFFDPVSHYPHKWPMTWAEVRSMLDSGFQLNIRPATHEEMAEADAALLALTLAPISDQEAA